ncbi:MAG: HIT domain-containing protein [Candidatus Marinimicrobia bacterium]|nr:HIT domain-containing protein [Candidatus Neomarinimicrobiota bacterium]
MKKLWAPWRMEYILAPKDNKDECIFCSKPPNHNDRDNLILYRGEFVFVIMNLYPYNNGHIMVVPYRHVDNTQALRKAELSEMMQVADASMAILKEKMKAQGFNFGANIGSAGGAGIEEHIHFHIVPRWIGDTNFMPVIGHTKVQVQGLQDSYDSLKPQFDNIDLTQED